jgi:DNA-binding IclR family transcriptional regulator
MKNPVMLTSQNGTRRPPYWGLLGPALMAYLPEEEVKRLLKRSPLKATTRYLITNRMSLWNCSKLLKRKDTITIGRGL